VVDELREMVRNNHQWFSYTDNEEA
jgi:hypothetical protein